MRKILSAVVAAVYFSVNCVLAHSTEANFWASRRAASQQVKGETAKLEEGDTVQRGNVLLAQLPMASPVDLARGKVDTAQASADVARTPFSIGPKTGDWLGKMVSPYGSVRDVYLSPLKDAPFIVHIQDAHGIEEAQRNISSMIEIMGQEPKIQLVGLEAAWGPFSFQPYRDYPDANITKEIADFFLKKGLIAGPEYAGLVLSKSPDFFGAEDKTLYDANVLALKTAYKNKQTVQTQMGVVLNNVAALKSVLYPEQLKIFDAHFEGYHSEKEKLAVYVRYLVEINEVVRAVSSVPNLELLVRALDEEDRLNFKLVEKERRDLVEQLANKLNVQQMQDLVAKSVDYRAGRVGYGDYHSHLIDVCRQHGIGVGQWAHLNRYISYVMLADKIDKNGLLEEMDALDRSIPERLAKTAAEKKLVSVVYDLTLMAKLLRHEMAPTDWAAYEKRVDEIHRLGDRLNELDPTGKWESLSAKTLKPFEDFCRYATQRNNALTDNLLRRMGETQAKSAVLVAGGFHTEGLSALLRQKQVSYVVVTPKITEIPRDNKYLDLLASDPVPLEKQLAGDRIYLAKVVGMTEKSTAGLMAAIQQVAQLKKVVVDMGNGYAITTDGAYPGAKVLFELGDGRKIYFVTNLKQEKPFMNFTSRLVNGSILVVKTLSIRFLSMMNAISLPATVKEDAIMLLGALGLIGGPLVSFAILLLLHIPNLIRIVLDKDTPWGNKILRVMTLLAALTILQLLWVDLAGSLETISNLKALEIAGGISLLHFLYTHFAKDSKWLNGAQATSDYFEGSFFIVKDVGDGILEKRVKSEVGHTEKFKLSEKDRRTLAELTYGFIENIRGGVKRKMNGVDIIPAFELIDGTLRVRRVEGIPFKTISEEMQKKKSQIYADWLEKTREQMMGIINAANSELELSYEEVGIVEGGWGIQVDPVVENNFLFDSNGNLVAWIDPIAVWPPKDRLVKEPARFDYERLANSAYYDPRNSKIQEAWSSALIRHNEDGTMSRVRPDYFEEWYGGGGVTAEVGKHYDAHGIAKSNPLGGLLNLLENGIDPTHSFHTAPLNPARNVGPGLGSSNGAYKDGPFIVLGERGKLISESGITKVLVADSVAGIIPALSERFPNVKFIPYSMAQTELSLEWDGDPKPAATIKALMPLYHWMGRAFNPDWFRIPANEKLEQIIEVYAPVVESVLFGVVFGVTLALLGFLGIDFSTLQTVGLWGAFNGIFVLSHRTFYVLENGEWKEKSLADVGKSTHLTLWVASLGLHLPLLGMMITPAAFTVPFFLSVFVSSVLGSGFHRFYNKWVARPFGLPALTAGGEEKDSRLNTEIGAIIGLLKEGRKLLNKPSPRKADVTTVFEDISDAITRLKTLSKNLNNPRMGYQQWEKDNISKIINEQIIQKRLIPSLQSLMGFVDKLSASQEEGAIAAAHKAIDLIGPHFDMYSDYERQNAPTPTEMHEKLDRKALERIASKKNVTADSVLSVAQDIRLSNSQVELLETLGAIERSGLKPSFPLMEVVGKNTGDSYRTLWEDTNKIIGSVYRPQFETDETEVSNQLSDLPEVLQMIIEDNKEGNAADFRRKYPNVDAFISDLSNYSDAPAPLAKLWFGMSEKEYATFVDNLFLTEISKGQIVIDGWKIFYHKDAFNGKLFPLNAIKALVRKFASSVEKPAQQRGGEYSKKGILRDDFSQLFWGFVKKDLAAREITILWFGTGQEAHANVSTDANSKVAETVFQRADYLNGENRLPLMGSEAPKKGSPVRGAVGEKPAATIKALMPLYHWMGRTFNPQWSRIPNHEKLEQIIEVYAPFVESVLFGVVFGGTLALLGFLGFDLSTLQTVGLWGAFNGIFVLSHRTFYVLENGEWKEKSLAEVGKSTHLTLWVASLGLHLPLLGMMITPAAFSVPFFLSVFVSSVLGSGFHRFYNKWVARPFGLPALTAGGNREFASQNNLAAMQNLSDYYSRLNKNTPPRILFVDQSGNLSRRVADHVRADLGKTNLPLEVGYISGFDLKAEGNKKIDFDMIVILNMGTQPSRVLSHWINQHKDSWSMAVQITLPESSSEEKTTLDVAEFSSTLVQVLSSSKSRTVVPSQSIKDIRALAGSIVDGFQNGRLNSFNDFFPGNSLSSIEDMLDSIARNVVKEKLIATSFRPLKGQPGRHMDVFEAVTLPGIIVKIPKPSYSIHDVEQYDMGELDRIRYGYSIAKKELGGLFAGQLLDNISFDLNGKTISPPFVIIQEKVTPLTEAFKNLDPNNARDVSDRERINTLLNETLEKMWMRGVVDIDFHNTANNYGLTRSGNIVGFDVDKIRYIADVESGLVSDVPVLKDLYTRVFGKYHEGKQQAVKGIRVHDVFESDVRQAQEAWLIEYLQKQPSQTRSKGVNNFAYYVFLSFGASKEFASKWGMRLLPLEISVLGWAGWMASGWAQAVFGALALDPTFMGAALMAAGILVFRGLHFALDKVWARSQSAQGPPSNTFWLNTARLMPYVMLPVLAASPIAFLVAFSVLAYDHFAFDLKQLLNRDLPLSNTAKLLVISMVSATFAVVIAPIIVSNLASPMGTFFLVSLAAQVFDPVTMQSFSENPASGLFALSVGTVSNFSTYALSMGWAPMALLGFATSALLSNTRWLPSLSVAQNYLSAYRKLVEIRPLNTHSSIEDYESFLIDGPHSLLTRGRLARNLEIARHTSGVKSVFYLGAGTDLTHVLTSFPDATHVTLSGNNYGTITAESIKNAMTTSHGLTGRSNELLTAYKESVSNNGFAGTSLVQNPVMQSSFLALELLSLGVQVGTIRSESGGGISFEVPGLLGRPSRRVSIVFKNNAFNGSPVQMNTGEQIYDGFFAKAIDGIQPYFMGVFSALADRLSSSLTVVSDRAVPDNMDDIGFREISKVTVSDEDSDSYGNAFQVVKLSRISTPSDEIKMAAKSVVALIESRKLAKIAINLKPNFEGTDYRSTFELQGETSRNDIDSAIRILGAANVSVQVAVEYGRQLALAEGNGTQKVAVLHGIASWEEKTRTIALAVVRGMLMAGKPVLIVAEAGFDTAIINYSGQTPIEVLNIAELNADLMNTVETQRSNRDVPLASTVLIREEDRAVLDGTNYSALTFEGISRAIQNALETLIATLRAA